MKDLISAKELTKDDIYSILDTAESLHEINRRDIKKTPALRGKTVVNLFFENSTRTRTSFEIAAKRLSADAVNFAASSSSTQKGETLLDTIKNIEAMQADILVLRHEASGAAKFIAERSGTCVINAGDGINEHPTQALLDIFTIRRVKKELERLTVTIMGDIAHSRVARSNIWAMRTLGMRVKLFGPPTLLPNDPKALACEIAADKREAVQSDVIITLRIQRERQGKLLIPSLREYSRFFGLNSEDLKYAPKDVLLLHPGPVNRGVELSSSLADGANSAILDQVENGVSVRMAVMCALRRQ
ncbi:MAG: aspartate carbamoyltransferase catalytic subunit [Deferribacteraceae bacterium]|jgi:aspartate carbamoyltransferase catalytic subunit|nr:aspartate carbamoyltransferase catalytic subunit [Deferribacteraceae bacterium]